MARPASRHPTELELEILKVLWEAGSATARQVQEALSPTRPLAITSVVTILNIMARKRYLQRKRVGASFSYKPRFTRQAISGGMLSDLVQRVYDGSVSAVLQGLFEQRDLDPKDLKELRRLVDEQSSKE